MNLLDSSWFNFVNRWNTFRWFWTSLIEHNKYWRNSSTCLLHYSKQDQSIKTTQKYYLCFYYFDHSMMISFALNQKLKLILN
ncbi:hypothetical protein BpHYR1_027722 [Brachionus plicatilis]|uniref:Uncharacterized protein n=1 Tax=Brachionus plicatilis TaxID=10195 RepID=A0A3M7SL47_BRAPC|nr:hypothetical protein BpHYR1_027722 [Brachionus plicatilis]